MEWINTKSDEVKRYANHVDDYNEKFWKWNVFADYERAEQYSKDNDIDIPF